jgi:hypothetical protein
MMERAKVNGQGLVRKRGETFSVLDLHKILNSLFL